MLNKFWQRFSPSNPTPQPQSPQPPRRSDAETEALFLRLLESLQPNRGRGQIQGFLIANSLREAELLEWLQQFGDRLLSSPEPNRELAERLMQFAAIEGGALGKAAEEIGQVLIGQPEIPNPIDDGTDVIELGDFSQAQAFFNQGDQQGRAGNFKEAIASFDQALHFNPDFCEAWRYRGLALSNLKHYEEAIKSYDQVLRLKPDDYQRWNDRGLTLVDLTLYEEAIASFDQALHFKPSYSQAWHNRGTTLERLGLYDEALSDYGKALYFKSDDHLTWCNQGVALERLGRGREAIISHNQALSLKPDFPQGWRNRGIALMIFGRHEEAIANYEQGLTHIHREIYPEGWGVLNWGMGQTYYNWARFCPHAEAYLGKAVTCYHAALQTLTPKSSPESHLKVVQDLIRAYLSLGNPQKADRWLRNALEVFRQILNQSLPTQRQQLETQFSGFSQIQIDLLLQDGQIITALETADRYKNRCLTWILDEWKEQVISPSYTEMRQLLREDTAIVYWHLSPDALTTFLLLPTESEPQVLDCDRATLLNRHKDFEAWKKDWDKQYQDYRPKKENSADKANHPWRNTLSDRLNQLRQILNLPALEQLLSGITHLILIPHRDLHRFPLHALFSNPFTCTYLPSAQIGLSLQNRSTPNLPTATLLSVEDPSGQAEMLYARIESAVIQQMFTHVTAIAPNQATPTAVTTALSQGYDLFHFTGHGEHNDRQPQNSAIAPNLDYSRGFKKV